ncbi:STAS domain-containing protein [Palleronia sp. LCG004]|uniref:STAS domain-containing protein n=1 Tax=Palleronia sp. LCG004 TaxID=3079304 RepID=UPI002942560E|nr:STAS domain-containing protein [Palleronia sp. LCG004]WOI56356.1 STAS domain-containing protein [Palleronia sp. LCG004]
MEFDILMIEDAMIVRVLADRVDAAVAVQFKDSVRDAAQDGPARVILDMQHVQFLDSSGLGAVIGAKKQLAPLQRLELSGLSPAVAKVFRLTRMEQIFTIHHAIPAIEGPAEQQVRQAHAY